MRCAAFSATLVAALAASVNAEIQVWGQCGGQGWLGDTTCASGSGCIAVNDYYSQCQPGAASTLPSTPSTGTPTTPDTPSAAGPGTELQTGYYWIRAVASPNYHKYMQSKPLLTTGPVVLGDYTTAGQFKIDGGQLMQLISSPGEAAKYLYANVAQERSINNASLAVSWTESKGTYGNFAWSGDALQWTVSGLTRPNPSAWYVCTGQKMYINLGNYNYQTPSGCSDQTIHYYNDKKANNKRERFLRV